MSVFRERLSKMWKNLQTDLFPWFERETGELSADYKHLVAVLELIRIEAYIPDSSSNEGRPLKDRVAIAKAFIAKLILKLPYTKQIIKTLNRDKQLAIICGFDPYKELPSESTFSRAFKDFADTLLPETVHQALIREIYKDKVVEHLTKDSTPIEVREKPVKKEGDAKTRKKLNKKEAYQRKKYGELNLRQKQLKESNLEKMLEMLPKQCDIGMKKSPSGYTRIWKGYKFHGSIDDNCIVLAGIVTSASTNDCEVAIPLAVKSKGVVNLYDLMDAAYDHPEIKEHSRSLGHVPIIDFCPKNKEQKLEKGIIKTGKLFAGYQTVEDRRYKKRFPAERFNAMFKDFFGGRNIFYRGILKVSCHLMFGVLALTATTILKLSL